MNTAFETVTNETAPNETAAHLQDAWVVFTGETDWPWLQMLRPGFRHCFVIINDGQGWVSVDPLLNHTDVQAYRHLPADFDLPAWLRKRGLRVLHAQLDRNHRRPAPLGVFTCVEAVKRILGLHARFVLTPWQLFRHLQKLNLNQGASEHGKHFVPAQSAVLSATGHHHDTGREPDDLILDDEFDDSDGFDIRVPANIGTGIGGQWHRHALVA
jgi:hypothetical protein